MLSFQLIQARRPIEASDGADGAWRRGKHERPDLGSVIAGGANVHPKRSVAVGAGLRGATSGEQPEEGRYQFFRFAATSASSARLRRGRCHGGRLGATASARRETARSREG